MDLTKLKADIRAAVREYAEMPEAWEDAVLVVDTTTGAVSLDESEVAEKLPDSYDVWNPMEFVEMTADGAWTTDDAAIDDAVEEYK